MSQTLQEEMVVLGVQQKLQSSLFLFAAFAEPIARRNRFLANTHTRPVEEKNKYAQGM